MTGTDHPLRKDRGFTLAVCLPNYNHAAYLRQALDALLAQSLLPDRIWICDDASTDASPEILREYAAQNILIQVVRNPENRGMFFAVERFLAESREDFVCFCASDDFVLPGFLEKSVGLLMAHPEAGLCSGLSEIVAEDTGRRFVAMSPRPLDRPGYVSPQRAAEFLYREGGWFWGNATMYRRSCLASHGAPDPLLGGWWDGLLSMEVALCEGACFIPEALAVWRKAATGTMSAQSHGNLDAARRIFDRALFLLDTRLRDRITPAFRRRFVRRWLYDLATRQMADHPDRGTLVRLEGLVRTYDPTLARILPVLAALPPALCRTALAVLLRRHDVLPALLRRFRFRLRFPLNP